ncbi:MAG: hypothetical protein LBM93_08690 [Oscillospiraceae bacterium]|jgi:hypothetical protein|nr:hypothetical protein [Oscillospiraceae bacterium]
MGVLSETFSTLKNSVTDSAENVYLEYDHQNYSDIQDEIFGIFNITAIKCTEKTFTQTCNIIPLYLTLGISVYANIDKSYLDILDFIDIFLGRLTQNTLNLTGMHISGLIYNPNVKRNVVKCEFTLLCKYKDSE